MSDDVIDDEVIDDECDVIVVICDEKEEEGGDEGGVGERGGLASDAWRRRTCGGTMEKAFTMKALIF